MSRMQYLVFLIPAEPLYSELKAVIQKLASDHEIAAFEPHVTLFAGQSTDEEITDVACRMGQQFSSLELDFDGVDFTDQYTKTLFIQFKPSNQAQQMTGFIKDNCRAKADYVLNPHLSLIYKKMPREQQTEISRTVMIPKNGYFFDAVKAMESETPLTESRQVQSWCEICRLKLKRAV